LRNRNSPDFILGAVKICYFWFWFIKFHFLHFSCIPRTSLIIVWEKKVLKPDVKKNSMIYFVLEWWSVKYRDDIDVLISPHQSFFFSLYIFISIWVLKKPSLSHLCLKGRDFWIGLINHLYTHRVRDHNPQMKIAKALPPDKCLRRYLLKTGRLMSQPYLGIRHQTHPLTAYLSRTTYSTKVLLAAYITSRSRGSHPLIYDLQQSLKAAYSTKVPLATYITPNTLPKEHDPRPNLWTHTSHQTPSLKSTTFSKTGARILTEDNLPNYVAFGDPPDGRLPCTTSIPPQDSPDPWCNRFDQQNEIIHP